MPAIQLINPEFWVEQLKDEAPIFKGNVFEALPTDEIAFNALTTFGSPCVLVSLPSEKANEPVVTSVTRQNHFNSVQVRIAINRTKTADDKLGQKDSQLLRLCRQDVVAALLGWTPADCNSPVYIDSGNERIVEDRNMVLYDYIFIAKDLLEN
jgi:hypothetical protein